MIAQADHDLESIHSSFDQYIDDTKILLKNEQLEEADSRISNPVTN